MSRKLVRCDEDFSIFTYKEDGRIPFNEADLHNTTVYVRGEPVAVIVRNEPDERTFWALGVNKFKKGEMVRVRPDIEVGEKFGHGAFILSSGMAELRGKVGVVEIADTDCTCYVFDYWWDVNMLERVDE